MTRPGCGDGSGTDQKLFEFVVEVGKLGWDFGVSDRGEIPIRQLLHVKRHSVAPPEAMIFFCRDENSPLTPVARHEDWLCKRLILIETDVSLKLGCGYAAHD